MKNKWLICCVCLLIIGLILTVILSQTTANALRNEDSAEMYVTYHETLYAGLICFALSAFFCYKGVTELGEQQINIRNLLILCGGLVVFGPMFALATAYKSAADQLTGYLGSAADWNGIGVYLPYQSASMEYAQTFSEYATIFTVLALCAVVIVAIGSYLVYKELRQISDRALQNNTNEDT